MAEQTVQVKSAEAPLPSASPAPANEWSRLVERIQQGDPDALTELYQIFGRGIRFFMYRQLGPQDIDDRVHDAFLVVVQAIQRGELRDPARLMGFVRTIVRRQVATRIDHLVQTRREQVAIEQGPVIADQTGTPEDQAMGGQQVQLMLSVLQSMSARDRDILTRFYLHEQSQEQICSEMNLTDTQYRLLKSRAKARFGDLGRRALSASKPKDV
jgi:RNA polymerase sigma factor (sigma-70 family)